MQPTPYHDLNEVMQEFARSAEEILAGGLVGLYLQGSFAVGDFDLHSDVDWVAVTEAEPRPDQVGALEAMHRRLYGMRSRWAQHLEGSYFPRDVIRSVDRTGEELWYIDNGSIELIRDKHCNTVLVRWVVRECGIPIVGPPPATLIDPIGPDVLRQDVYETLQSWGQEILDAPERWANRFYQGFIVLHFCRALHDLHRGANCSKLAGAEWAIRNLDPRWAPLIDRSWARRANPANWIKQPPDPEDYALTLEFVRYAMEASRSFPGD